MIIMQDIPDIDGDRIFGIRSFSVRLGQRRVSIKKGLNYCCDVGEFLFADHIVSEQVFWICVYLLEMAYSVAVVIGATSSCTWSKIVTVCYQHLGYSINDLSSSTVYVVDLGDAYL